MNIVELNESIRKNIIPNLIIMYGEDYGVMNIYINQIKSRFSDIFVSDDVVSIYQKLSGVSLISGGNRLYVIHNDDDFIISESLWENLENNLQYVDAHLILKYDKIDSRSKFYKRFSGSIVLFDRLNDQVLKKYVSNMVKLKSNAVDFLMNGCNYNYGKILLEVDKIKNYAQAMNVDDNTAFIQCLSEGAFSLSSNGSIYDFVNSILSNNIDNIKLEYVKFKSRGDNPIALLSLLHTNVKSLLQVQLCARSSKIYEITGLQAYQIKSLSKYVGCRSNEALVKMIKYILYCDKSVKNGTIQSSDIIDYLLIFIL